MSYATWLIEKMIRETSSDNYQAFLDLLETKPMWFPEKASVDMERTTNKLIYCVIDEFYPMSPSALNSFKKKIQKKAEEYFTNVNIVDNDDGFSILVS